MPITPLKPNSSTTLNDPSALAPGKLIQYELHGKPVLGIVDSFDKGKWVIENEEREKLSLNPQRIFVFKNQPTALSPNKLKDLARESKKAATNITLEPLWGKLHSQASKENDYATIFAIYCSISNIQESTIENELAFRQALLEDKIYFRRSKLGFLPKSEEEIKSGKEILRRALEEQTEKLKLELAIKARLQGKRSQKLPTNISFIENIAALGRKAPKFKIYAPIVENICKQERLCDYKISIEEKSFLLLEKIGQFTKDQNLSCIRIGRPTIFNAEERMEAETLHQRSKQNSFEDRVRIESPSIFTIDSESSSDLDDALSLEKVGDELKVGIHITDVSATILPQTILDETALRRATSVYCPDETIPMLPHALSEGVLSLKENLPRPCITFFLYFDTKLNFLRSEIHNSLVHVTSRLSYDTVDKVLDGSKDIPEASDLKILAEIFKSVERTRIATGAIQFARRDLIPNIDARGKISLVSNSDDTPAKKLVSESMIFANTLAAQFSSENKIPFVYRSQESQDLSLNAIADAMPEGPAKEFKKRGTLKRSETSFIAKPHSGLGVPAYCQITSPIRRALDLVLIRQLSSFLASKELPYTESHLSEILEKLSPGLEEAHLIQRERNRYWLLRFFEQEKVTELSGTIVRTDPPRPLAELDNYFSIMPFNPKSSSQESPDSGMLGKRVTLKITKLDSRREKLYLTEA